MKLPIMKIGSGVFLVFLLLVISCSENEPVQPDSGLDYFPLQIGNYSIYQVDETRISQNVETKFSYELKVTIINSAAGSNGAVTYILNREKRNNDSEDWESLDTWSVKIVNNRVIQNEGNVLFVKLIFPPSENLSWDGNKYNNLADNNEIFYDGDDTPYIISAVNNPVSLETGFDSQRALTVIQNDRNDIFTGVDERKEIYAKDVGLIYKELKQLKYCTASTCYGQQKIDQGVIFIQSLKEYGKM